MQQPSFVPSRTPGGRVRIAEIDSLVSARLGPTRGLGNSQPACFNRQVAMYLAARIGRWSTAAIGQFYNGRDHSTVCHAIQRIEALKETNPEVDALLTDLERRVRPFTDPQGESGRLSPLTTLDGYRPIPLSQKEIEVLAKAVADEVCALLKEWLGCRIAS